MFNCTTPSIDDLTCNPPYANLNDTKKILDEFCNSTGSCVYNFTTEQTQSDLENYNYNSDCEEYSIYTPEKHYLGNRENIFETCNYNDNTYHAVLTANHSMTTISNGLAVNLNTIVATTYLPSGGINSIFAPSSSAGTGYRVVQDGLYLLSANYRIASFGATWDFPLRAVIGFSVVPSAGYISLSETYKEFPTTNPAIPANVCGAPVFITNNNISISAIIEMEVGNVFGFGITNPDLINCIGSVLPATTLGVGSTFTITKLE